jgi:hypothetical protein
MTVDAATEAVSTNGNTAEAGLRSCPVCGGPVPEDRRVTCSKACAQKRDHHHNRNGKQAKPTMAKAQIPAGISLPASPAPGLSAAVVALVDSLGDLSEMQRVTIELDTSTVTVTRAS